MMKNSKNRELGPVRIIKVVGKFSESLIKANFKNWKTLLVSLGLPIFMLLMFWITTQGDAEGDFDLMGFMFPAIIALSVMLAGLSQATRVSRWREQEIFRRLALTPIPLPVYVLSMALAQIVTGILQGITILLIGLILGIISTSIWGIIYTFLIIIISAITFIAYGSLIATLVNRAEVAGYVFFFTFLPLFFLGSFPRDMLPMIMQKIIPWFPTTMAIELISHQFTAGLGTGSSIFSIIGLSCYSILFSIICVLNFKWKVK